MKPIEILLVEDNAGDAFLIREVLRESLTPINLHVARDGMQALLMLAGYLAKPDLVILDLDMPNISGHAMLEKYHPNNVPIVVFSSSWNDSDAQYSLASGAREFVRKPTDLQAYRNAVSGMIEKWVAQKG
jgi:CheY-like chemotaxis protein